MWNLIKKDMLKLFSYVFPVFLLFLLVLFGMSDRGDKDSPFFWGMWMFVLISGGISHIEKYEEKNQGYRFLKQLPISDKKIIHSKFLLLFMAVLSVVILNMILIIGFPVPGVLKRVSFIFILLIGWFFLLMAGIIYILIYKKGFSKGIIYVWLSFVGCMVFFIFFSNYLFGILQIRPLDILSFMEGLHYIWWIIFSLVSLGLYSLLMKIAIRTFTRSSLNETF